MFSELLESDNKIYNDISFISEFFTTEKEVIVEDEEYNDLKNKLYE